MRDLLLCAKHLFVAATAAITSAERVNHEQCHCLAERPAEEIQFQWFRSGTLVGELSVLMKRRHPEVQAEIDSGKPPGRPRGSRNALTEAVICAILRDFSKHGEKAVAEVRRKQPAAYLKICALLVPREHKVEQINTYEGLSTEQIEAYIAAIQDRLDRRAAGAQPKVIEGER